ncbi:hypothetical protein COOONC_07194 [Cooperia oncophora]
MKRSTLEAAIEHELRTANVENTENFSEEKLFNVKQECPEDDGLNLTPGDIPASAATEPTLAFLLSNNINKKTEEMAKEPPQTSSAG